jgi:ankyrin repeat protein
MRADQPIPLIYSGQAGDYFGTEYEGLPGDLPEAIQRIDRQLQSQGLQYFGKLTCSQFQFVHLYSYGTADQRVVVSVMVGEDGMQGIDCVSRFADGSFLTTTTVKVLQDAYDEQRLFRVSFPGLSALELLDQHLLAIGSFEARCGAVLAGFDHLLAIAQLVDEYTQRQESNSDYGILQFLGGFAQGQFARMMESQAEDEDTQEEDGDNEEDAEEDDDEIEDRIEYDEAAASPLVKAILQDDLAQVEQLLAAGATVNPEMKQGSWDEAVPLAAAVFRGNPAIIQRLIAAGANLDRLDLGVDARPLGVALKQNRPDLVRLLLNAGASPEGGDMSYTGLTIAVNASNLPLVKLLLEAGADPNSDMEDGDRAILHAAWTGNLEIVQCLVAHGADVNTWSQGDTAIDRAANNGHQEMYDYLYPMLDEDTRRYADKHGPKDLANAIKRKARVANKLNEKLGDAALYGKTKQVQQFLTAGADPNAITESGKTPLMYAAMYGHTAAIEALLNAGADPNVGGDDDGEEGQTALMCIASSFFANNRAEVIRLLIDRGADPNQQDDQGQTALMIAGENADAVKALLDAGANPDLRDAEGNSAMMLGNWAIQQLLRQAGASEEGLNDVALTEAARDGDLPRVEALLASGSRVNYGDGSALTQAANYGHLAIVDRLIQAGADVNLGWKTGKTAIATAAYAGNLAIVQRLLAAGANPFQRCHDEDFYDALGHAEMGQAEGNHPEGDYPAVIALIKGTRS